VPEAAACQRPGKKNNKKLCKLRATSQSTQTANMAGGSTIKLPHLEAYPVHVSLFQDVKNADFLRQQLLQGNTDFEYAFMDATTIISVNHLLAAVFRAMNDMLQNRLKSRNVHSEIVFSLSPNNNVSLIHSVLLFHIVQSPAARFPAWLVE
jgi:hypothetical protein